jgi:transposase
MTIIGIDVSKDWLDVAQLGATTTTSRVANTPEAVARFVTQIGTLEVDRIGLEATGAYHLPVLAALLAAKLPVSLINPAQIAAYRQVRLVRHKTDRQDALLIAHFTQTYAQELRLAHPATPVQAQVRELVGYREGRVKERTRLLNQQEAARWAGSATVQTLLAADLDHVEQQLAEVDHAIAALLAEVPEAAILQQVTGVGPRIAAIVLAYLPAALWGQVKPAVGYAGMYPRLVQSGRSSQSRLSKAGPPPLRRALYLAALVAVRHDPDIQQRYERFRARGKPPKEALCVIGHALLRHMMGAVKASYRQPDATPEALAA